MELFRSVFGVRVRLLCWTALLAVGCGGADRKDPRKRRGGPDGTEPTESTEPDRGPIDRGTPDPVGSGEACYLGGDRDGSACLGVVEVVTLPDEYDYPEPLSGSSQYTVPLRYLDLQAHASSVLVAPNFALGELAQASKGRFGVVQTDAVDRLQAVRDEVGVLFINSGYRSPDYNEGVGGATWSRHMYGDAFDIDPGQATLVQLADACEQEGAGWVGLYETHVHCDWRDDPMDPAFYTPLRSVVWTEQPWLDAWIESDDLGFTAPALGWDEGEPLREWVARDEEGQVLATHVGRSFEPPDGTAQVEVVVGRALTARVSVD